MKHVLYISYTGMLEPLGQSQVLAYLKRLHTTQGYTYTLISYEKPKDYNQVQLKKLREELAVYGIRWHPLKYHQRPTLLATLFDVVVGMVWVAFFLALQHVDIIHVRSYIPLCIALPFKKLLRKPLIFDMRGFWADERADAGQCAHTSYEYKAIKALERQGLRTADQIVVLTAQAKAELPRIEPATQLPTISVIPCCVDLEQFKFDPTARQRIRTQYGWHEQTVLVYSGSLGGLYLTQELIELFGVWQQLNPKIHLLLLTRSEHTTIEQLLEAHAIPPQAYTIHSVPLHEVAAWLSAADGAVSLRKVTYSQKASSPTKFAEYLACRLPVLANTGIGDLDQQIKTWNVGTLLQGFTKNEYIAAWNQFSAVLHDSHVQQRCRDCAQHLYHLDIGVNSYTTIYDNF